MKQVVTFAIFGLVLSTGLLTGCDALSIIKNNVDMCSVIDCAQLGIVDIAGPHNPLVPSEPDYSKDPTCTLPGFCGPSIWYPYSIAETSSGTTAKVK